MEVDHRNRNCYNCRRFGHQLETVGTGEQEAELGKVKDWNIKMETMDKGEQLREEMDKLI